MLLMAEGQTRFTNDNVVLFVHGATCPSTPDFDLPYKDYSWPTGWMRPDHAFVKKSVMIKNATHFVMFENPALFGDIDNFLKARP